MHYIESEIKEYRTYIKQECDKLNAYLMRINGKKLDLQKVLELSQLRGILEGLDFVMDLLEFYEEY